MTSDAGTPAGSTGKDMELSGTPEAATDVCRSLIFRAFFFLTPACGVLAPPGIVPLLLAAAALLAAAVWRAKGKTSWPLPDLGLTAALGGLTVFCALASIWGFDPPDSLLLAGRIAILFAAGLFLHAALRHLDQGARTQAGNWFLAGLGLALALLYLEPALGYPVLGLLRGPETLARYGPNLLSRGAIMAAILCWPACALLWRRTGALAALCLPAAVLAALAFLSSQSAGFGLLAGAAALAAAASHRRAGRIVLIAATLGAMLISPLAGNKFYEARLQDADWLPMSAGHRIEIWHYTVQRIAEKPVLGWGFDAARHMKELTAVTEASGRDPIALHPHNAPLQILLELGVLGALLVLAVAWLLIQRLETLPRRDRLLGQATYMAGLAISTTAFGFWQNQWLALLITATLAVALTAPARARPGSTPARPRPGSN